MSLFSFKRPEMPSEGNALPGRENAIATAQTHFVNGRSLEEGYPEGSETVYFGMGCFWGAERIFWQTDGVWVTSVGYAGGATPNATYEEVCSGRTGHTEVVKVVFDPTIISFAQLLQVFWKNHNPTQGMRQGNDVGTQYRSAVYVTTKTQADVLSTSKAAFQKGLTAASYGAITTETGMAGTYFMAEDYHQQYLEKNPGGYCGIRGTGVSCPAGIEA